MANDEAIIFVCRYPHDTCLFSTNMAQSHKRQNDWIKTSQEDLQLSNLQNLNAVLFKNNKIKKIKKIIQKYYKIKINLETIFKYFLKNTSTTKEKNAFKMVFPCSPRHIKTDVHGTHF